MMSLFEAAWVIARRDFVASVFSRSFILFLLAPLLLFGFALFFGTMADAQDRSAAQPVVAVVADSATADALARGARAAGRRRRRSRASRSCATSRRPRMSRSRRRRLLADEDGGYSAVLSGTLDRPVLTGPHKVDDYRRRADAADRRRGAPHGGARRRRRAPPAGRRSSGW